MNTFCFLEKVNCVELSVGFVRGSVENYSLRLVVRSSVFQILRASKFLYKKVGKDSPRDTMFVWNV